MYKVFCVLGIMLLALVATGCTSPSEKVAETIIESQTNGDVDVDVDNETVSINTDGGSFQSGEDVTLPDGFPSDVHVAEGTLVSAIHVTDPDGYSVSLNSSDSVTDLKSEYQSAIVDDGWTILGTYEVSGSVSFTAEKDNRTLSVTIGATDDQSSVVISTSTDSE
ncbi:MAG: hypothetical protein HZC01_04555 [Candidatus Kerfeldbacteria bacterium]|nr:hypothetical protein [Candidatus Kerfeldbacteria bacterium]